MENEINTYYDGLVAVVDDRKILMEGPLAKQFHDCLQESHAIEVSENGLALESTMLSDQMEMGSLWFTLQEEEAGYLYAPEPSQAGIRDAVRFKSVVNSLNPKQRDLSALYLPVNDDAEIHDSQLWIRQMERVADQSGVTVIRNVDDYLKIMNNKKVNS